MPLSLKALGTKSDMATNTDMDMNDSNRTGNTGRARGILAIVVGMGRGLKPPSPPWVGRGPNIFQMGRGRGLRPPSLPHPGGRARIIALLQQLVESNNSHTLVQMFPT